MSDYTKEREALYAIWNNESEETYMSVTPEGTEQTLIDYVERIQQSNIEPQESDMSPTSKESARNTIVAPSKYHRQIKKDINGWSDIYDTLDAYRVDNPAIAHAVKKMLCAGTRGYKDYQQDIQEAIDSLERAKDFPPIPF